MDRAGSISDPGSTSYSYDDADELTTTVTTPSGGSATTSTDSYDADGNLTTDGRTWNVLNQLTGSQVGGVTASYAYDGLGNRVSVTSDTGPSGSDVTRGYSWDIDNPLPMLAVITNPDTGSGTGSGTSTDTQTYAPDGTLLSSTHPEAAYTVDYYTHDALGSIVDDLQGDGTLLTQTAYDPYGNIDAAGTTTVTAGAGAVDVGFGYTGAYTEPTTGQIALRARDYDPTTGRFTARDPITQRSGTPWASQYVYVNNQVTSLTDPSGKCTPYPACSHDWNPLNQIVNKGLHQLHEVATGAVGGIVGLADYTQAGTADEQVTGRKPSQQFYDWTYEQSGIDGTEPGTMLGSILGVTAASFGIADVAGACALAGEFAESTEAVESGAGSLVVQGEGFSSSERAMAEHLVDQGHRVVLRAADSAGPRTSDLLVDGVPYDVYSPTTNSADNVIRQIASKGSQVRGGGIVVDLSKSSLEPEDLGNVLARVRGLTSNVTKVIVVK